MEKKEISLMQGYAVQIQGMVEDGTSGYLHLVDVPKDALPSGKDLTLCKLSYSLDEPTTIVIFWELEEYNNNYIIAVDEILLTICQAYQDLEKNGHLIDNSLSDLWIHGLKLVDGRIEALVSN